jgi:aminoglycoside 6'-N-acetyltransferase I
MMKIIPLLSDNDDLIRQAAQLLVDAFREHWPEAWPTLEEGLKEVHEMLETERICRAAVDEKGNLLGIIGGIPGYDGHVWELHPLAVQPFRQGQGIGRALVEDFEEQVRLKGGLTITLGSDDEDDMTSLSNVDLYENLWEKIRDIRNLKNHPFEFYQKMGYVVTGVVPDANGIGKPDILMAKRIASLRDSVRPSKQSPIQ